ncbi:hypothetical protein [Veronia pacifica]|uniref:Bacterial virulence factor lipase N-terminal domain-containing protein n=1 Tax=Veronia pacifica TaxID=1080227 RepID=A0A1C3EJS2_9GAMM|nr:hypothetical protein [Veronia pacifica]ODA33491.1 hypothetical protein A8L45_09760 [Veronia pacifica]
MKLNHNKKNHSFIGVLFCLIFFLSGCEEGGLSGNPTIGNLSPDIQSNLGGKTRVNFVLSGPEEFLPLPSFIIQDAIDGTINAPREFASSIELDNAYLGLSSLDGWGLSSYIFVEFLGTGFGPEQRRVDRGFYLYELDRSMEEGSPVLTRIPAEAYTRGQNLVIQPLQVLKPKTDYFYAITNEILDEGGNPISSIQAYATLAGGVTLGLGERLNRVSSIIRKLNQSMFDINSEVDLSNVVFSMAYTTQSIGETTEHTKLAIVKGLERGGLERIWKGASNPRNVDLSDAYKMEFGTTTDFLRYVRRDTNFETYVDIDDEGLKERLVEAYGLLNTIGNPNIPIINLFNLRTQLNITPGTIKLPYFLETIPDKIPLTPFERATPNLATVRYILERGELEDKAAVTKQLVKAGIDMSQLATLEDDNEALLKLMGLEMVLDNGEPIETIVTEKAAYGGIGAAQSTVKVVTRYNPIPKIKALEDVKFLLFTPKKFNPNKPVKLIIFQHPITASKEAAMAIAPRFVGLPTLPPVIGNLVAAISAIPGVSEIIGLLSGQGNDLTWLRGNDENIALIAIDHPLHGDRCISDEQCTSEEPTLYLNLQAFPVGRDNFRQSTFDNLGLRLGLALAQEKRELDGTPLENLEDLAVNPPSLVSHSFGGVNATHTAVYGNKSLGGELGELYDDRFSFSKLALANTGSQVPLILINSEEYQSLVKHIVAATLSAGYQKFIEDNPLACGDEKDVAKCYDEFEKQAGNNADLAAVATEVEGSFDLFGIAAQTSLDNIDPVTITGITDEDGNKVLDGLPIYLQEVASDNTKPTNIDFAPFAGSRALAKSLGMNIVDQNSPTALVGNMPFALPQGDRNFVKYEGVADHLTFIGAQSSPDDEPHSGHMQTTVLEFLIRDDHSFDGVPTQYLQE